MSSQTELPIDMYTHKYTHANTQEPCTTIAPDTDAPLRHLSVTERAKRLKLCMLLNVCVCVPLVQSQWRVSLLYVTTCLLFVCV